MDDSYYLNIIKSDSSNFFSLFNVFGKVFNQGEYRPVTSFILGIENYIFGLNPKIFHFFNLIYYSILIYTIYHFIEKNKIFDSQLHNLLFLLLFASHPTHVEVVASIKNRESILSLFFCLIYFIHLEKALFEEKKIYYLSAIFFSFLSFFSKRDCAPLLIFGVPLLLVLKVDLINVLSFCKERYQFIISFLVLFILINFYAEIANIFILPNKPDLVFTYVDHSENPFFGTNNLMDKVKVVYYSICFYLCKIILPVNLYFYYGYTEGLYYAIGTIILIAITTIFYQTENKTKALKFSFLWSISGIFFFLNIMDFVAGIVSIRYLFPSSFGILLLFSYLVWNSVFLLGKNRYKFTLLAITIFIFSIISINETNDWKNFDALFKGDSNVFKKSNVANRIAGEYYYEAFKDSDFKNLYYRNLSKSYCQNGLYISPNDVDLLNTKSNIFLSEGNLDSAEITVYQSIKLDSLNFKGYGIYSYILNEKGKYNDAILLLKNAFIIKQKFEIFRDINRLYFKNNLIDSALEFNQMYKNNLKLYPELPRNIGDCYLLKGDTINAIKQYKIAFKHGLNNEILAKQISDYELLLKK
ncbi:MAG: hypothetical protein KA275_07010 [Chitinophagaceae bacterium]|nr:hypothetical protein [Chitinophagaceae bacterium]